MKKEDVIDAFVHSKRLPECFDKIMAMHHAAISDAYNEGFSAGMALHHPNERKAISDAEARMKERCKEIVDQHLLVEDVQINPTFLLKARGAIRRALDAGQQGCARCKDTKQIQDPAWDTYDSLCDDDMIPCPDCAGQQEKGADNE